MHAMKVSWGGQAFALAKSNDAGSKKSRIRRTKEERRAMVESFINKYQSSNNGNFPSLNLTHKEVGGSFYTVREIVRDIIQDNRVLGPATAFSEEDILDNCSGQYTSVSPSASGEPHAKSCLSSAVASVTEHGKINDIDFSSEVQEDLARALRGQQGQYYEMVESKEQEKLKSHLEDIYIPRFIHEDAVDQQMNFYGDVYMNGSLIDEDCKPEEAMKSPELGEIKTGKDERRNSEVCVGENLADGLVTPDDNEESSTASSLHGGLLIDSITSDTLSEDMGTRKMHFHQSSISNFSSSVSSEVFDTAGTQEQDTSLPLEEVQLNSDLIHSAKMFSDAVGRKQGMETATSYLVSENSPDELLDHLKGMDEGSSSDNNLLKSPPNDQKQSVTGEELKLHSTLKDSLVEKATSSTNNHTNHGEAFSSVTHQGSSSESSEKASDKSREAVEPNPFWTLIKSFVSAFVKFWVE